LNARLVSSDFFGMRHTKRDGAAKVEFEDAVVESLRDPSVDVVIYDKNIPNFAGYNCMKSVAARAGVIDLMLVPVVPDACSQEQADVCIARVLQREEGTHTLTSATVVDGHASTEDFIRDVFSLACMDFIPVASVLPRAVILPGFYSIQDSSGLREVASRVVDELGGWSSKKEKTSGIDLTSGTYLGLKFELDAATKSDFEQILGIAVREKVHVTIQHYGTDGDKMQRTAQLVKSIDMEHNGKTRDVCVTRLGKVLDESGAISEERRVLAWGSCVVTGFEDLPLHITLAAEGFKNMDSRDAEDAYAAGVVNINGITYQIETFALEPVTFEATWAVE
jgi:hypothetical protein